MKLSGFLVGLEYSFSQELVYVFLLFYGFLGGEIVFLQVLEVSQSFQKIFSLVSNLIFDMYLF